MKRTYPANIDGQIFYIDEDAYLMLQDYLLQLKATFRGSEGDEIVSDIESRIRELFSERIAAGAAVIVRADVASVIETMGRPEQISGEDNDAPGDFADTTGPEAAHETRKEENRPFIEFNLPKRKRLYRNMKNKVFGGVLGGIAAYLGWNANILRLFYTVVTIMFMSSIGGLMVVLYLIAWMIVPPADTAAKVLQMKGEPVNVDTVGREFMAGSPAAAEGREEESSNFFSSMFSIAGKLIVGFLGIIGSLIFIGCLIGFFTIAICQICATYNPTGFLTHFLLPWDNSPLVASMILVWCTVGAIIGGALSWTAACAIFNASPASKTFKITAFIMEILLISAGIALSLMVAGM